MNSITRIQDGVKLGRKAVAADDLAEMYTVLVRSGVPRLEAAYTVDASFMTSRQLSQHYPNGKGR
jgi:hypothetical protein